MKNGVKTWLTVIGLLVVVATSFSGFIYAVDQASQQRDTIIEDKMEGKHDILAQRTVELEKQYTRIDTKLGYIDDGMREQKTVNAKILDKLDQIAR